MPVPAWTLEPGIGYAITDDGPLTQYETWPGRPSKSRGRTSATSSARSHRSPRCAAAGCWRRTRSATSSCRSPTARISTVDRAAAATRRSRRRARRPTRLRRPADSSAELPRVREHGVDSRPALSSQRRSRRHPPSRSRLAGQARAASHGHAGRASARPTTPMSTLPPSPERSPSRPASTRWTLDVGGQGDRHPRPAFGSTTGYDIAAAGPATLRYHTSTSRALALIGQLVLWLLLALGVSRFDTASIAAPATPSDRRRSGCTAAVDRCTDRGPARPLGGRVDERRAPHVGRARRSARSRACRGHRAARRRRLTHRARRTARHRRT